MERPEPAPPPLSHQTAAAGNCLPHKAWRGFPVIRQRAIQQRRVPTVALGLHSRAQPSRALTIPDK